MRRLGYILPVALFVLAAAGRLHAQIGGCVDSPENPTAILALVGAAGVGIAHLRARLGSRNK